MIRENRSSEPKEVHQLEYPTQWEQERHPLPAGEGTQGQEILARDLILPLHNTRRLMRVGVLFNLGNLSVAAMIHPAVFIVILLAFACFG